MRRQAFALRKREIVALDLGRGRWAAARLLLLVDYLMQAAMLEHDALAWLHAVDAAIEDAGDEHVRSIDPPGCRRMCRRPVAKPDFHVRPCPDPR